MTEWKGLNGKRGKGRRKHRRVNEIKKLDDESGKLKLMKTVERSPSLNILFVIKFITRLFVI